MSESLRIIFAGTPDFAARHLDALLSSGHNVVGVFTQPDRPAGRGKKLMPSPVKVLAEEKGLPVFQPVSLRPQENQQLVADLQADVMVAVSMTDAFQTLTGCPSISSQLIGHGLKARMQRSSCAAESDQSIRASSLLNFSA